MRIVANPDRLDSLPLPTKIHRNLQRIVVDELKDQYDAELSAIWKESGTFLIILGQDEHLESCPPLASQLTYCAIYPEIVESLSEGWVLLLGIYSSEVLVHGAKIRACHSLTSNPPDFLRILFETRSEQSEALWHRAF